MVYDTQSKFVITGYTVFITDTLGTNSNVLIVLGGESYYAVRVKSDCSVFIPLDVQRVFWSRHCIESAVSLTKGEAHTWCVAYILMLLYAVRISPALNRSSEIQCFEHNKNISNFNSSELHIKKWHPAPSPYTPTQFPMAPLLYMYMLLPHTSLNWSISTSIYTVLYIT